MTMCGGHGQKVTLSSMRRSCFRWNCYHRVFVMSSLTVAVPAFTFSEVSRNHCRLLFINGVLLVSGFNYSK